MNGIHASILCPTGRQPQPHENCRDLNSVKVRANCRDLHRVQVRANLG